MFSFRRPVAGARTARFLCVNEVRFVSTCPRVGSQQIDVNLLLILRAHLMCQDPRRNNRMHARNGKTFASTLR